MIRLTLPAKPVELTPELEQDLIAEFRASGKAVWHETFIKTPLLEMTCEKCAYCEQILGEARNITFDHYVHKDFAPERVVEWGNLLPCCQPCNSNKHTYNVLTEPFFSPIDTHIQTHLEFTSGGMFKGITSQGKALIERLKLNQSNQKAPPRYRLIQAITQLLIECDELCEILEQENKSRERTKLRNKVGALLNMTSRKSPFSALAATTLLSDSRSTQAKVRLISLSDWSALFEQMWLEARAIALVFHVHKP